MGREVASTRVTCFHTVHADRDNAGDLAIVGDDHHTLKTYDLRCLCTA